MLFRSKSHNDREWFAKHKELYLSSLQNVQKFSLSLERSLKKIEQLILSYLIPQ